MKDEALESVLAARQTEILSEMKRDIADSARNMANGWAEHLLKKFTTELNGESPSDFLQALDEVLLQEITADGDVARWQEAVSALRRQTLPYLNREELLRAINLWEQACVTISEAAQRQKAYQGLQADEQAQKLREVGSALITAFDLEELMNGLAEKLPGLGIPSCYLALYENPQPYEYPQPAPEWSRLMLA